MKKTLYLLLPLLTMLFVFSACIESDDDDNVEAPNCVIASFSIGDIVSSYTTTINGVDTTYSRTISGSSVYFNIDQINGVISSVDSLPYWANIKRIVPTISYTGAIYCRQGGEGNDYLYFSSGNDSIDFSGEVDFLVVSNDGNYTKNYKAVINKSENEKDSLYWTAVSSNIQLDGPHRTLSKDGSLFVFAYNNGQPTVTTAEATGKNLSWTTPQTLSENIDYRSVTLFQNDFYALNDKNWVCWSEDGINWEITNDEFTFDRILASDNWKLYAYDGSSLYASADGVNWDEEPANDLSMLPEMPVSSAVYTSKTNANIQNVVMLGCQPAADKTVAWFKVSAEGESNQKWNYINISADNNYPLPDMSYVQMVRYNGSLLAIGNGTEKIQPYNDLYISEDNGITWRPSTARYGIVTELAGTTRPVTMTVCGKNLWIIQSGGNVWRGVID